MLSPIQTVHIDGTLAGFVVEAKEVAVYISFLNWEQEDIEEDTAD